MSTIRIQAMIISFRYYGSSKQLDGHDKLNEMFSEHNFFAARPDSEIGDRSFAVIHSLYSLFFRFRESVVLVHRDHELFNDVRQGTIFKSV